MYICIFLLRMTNTMTSQNIDFPPWDTLYKSYERKRIGFLYFFNQLCHWQCIAWVVSRWLSTAVARFRARVRSCGICGGQSGIAPSASFSSVNHSTNCSTVIIIIHHPLLVHYAQ
jgi:hypothetical protein